MHADIPQVDAFKWLGVVMIAVACVGVGGQYFPMWGGMLFPARKGYTEEDFYFAEYSTAERERGLHLASSAFVSTPYVFFTLMGCTYVPCGDLGVGLLLDSYACMSLSHACILC